MNWHLALNYHNNFGRKKRKRMKLVLETNNFWTLSKDNNVLSFDSCSNSTSLAFQTRRGLYNKKEHFDFIEYSWLERKTKDYLIYENGDALKFIDKKLVINRKTFYFLYAERDTTVYNNASNIYKITEYDYNLNPRGHCLGILNNSTYLFKKICDLNNAPYYYIYYWNNISRIICQEGTDVRIVTLDHNGLIKQNLVINDVENLYRLTRKDGNVTYLFSFFVLKTKNRQIVLNIKSLLYIDIQSKNLMPYSFSVKKKDYLAKIERFVVKQEQEFLCIDNTIYDENLKKVLSITTDLDSNPVLLDSFDCYFAVSDYQNNIHILKWNPVRETRLDELHYTCRFNDSNQKSVSLIIEDEQNTYVCASFDPVKKKFVINIDQIRSIYGRKESADYYMHDDFGIMDALDGDPEAYWNID